MLRLRERYSSLEPPDRSHVGNVPVARKILIRTIVRSARHVARCSGNPQLRTIQAVWRRGNHRPIEFARHDRDDDTRRSVQRDVAADDAAIAAKPSDPETITEDNG